MEGKKKREWGKKNVERGHKGGFSSEYKRGRLDAPSVTTVYVSYSR